MASTFLGFPAAKASPRLDADIAILGAPHATPYRTDQSPCAGAPAALRERIGRQADKLAHHDFDLGGPLLGDEGDIRVVDCGDLSCDPTDADGNRERIAGAVDAILNAGAVPIVLGGDDSVVIPVVAGFKAHGPVCVVQVDAHIDWRDEVNGIRHGYSSPMRRASEMPWVTGMIQVGLRGVGSARRAELDDALAWGSHIVTAREIHQSGIETALRHIPEGARCFITIDCDGLDPSVIPAVVAPAPGGLTYWQVVDLIHGIAERAQIAGMDLVEFAPGLDPNGHAALAAARLVSNTIGTVARAAGEKAADT
ncbi:MAG: agmatinase [Alphaproteobacteria bacterium]|nr:agmatinase [Alphaproteobacteria bacterium]